MVKKKYGSKNKRIQTKNENIKEERKPKKKNKRIKIQRRKTKRITKRIHMRYNSKNQSIRKMNGVNNEKFVNLFYKGEINKDTPYEIISKNYLVEVKSCNCLNKLENRVQLGRFVINTDNHVSLYLYSQKLKKIPIYVFVLNINGFKINKKKTWEEVNKLIDNTKENHLINWRLIFYDK